ncbi:MAG: pyridoxamine 5'-phosphate oxidase family protein [Propionibacteriaceae bacterium]|nr:pyridoxamine 5'-phosphate oxidase family protein [Propionibacteriaceae bacterium]
MRVAGVSICAKLAHLRHRVRHGLRPGRPARGSLLGFCEPGGGNPVDRSLTPTRLAEKAVTDRDRLDALLDSALVAHVGLVVEDGPLVVPTGFARDGDRLLLHGSTGSRWLRALAAGTYACVTVTELTGLVVARSGFESSMHYRSACLFGTFEPLAGDDASRALELFTERVLPGRAAEVRPSTPKELAATLVVALGIGQWSLKVSAGWPDDPAADVAGDAWAGVIPIRSVLEQPIPAPDVRAGIDIPDSVRRLLAGRDVGSSD